MSIKNLISVDVEADGPFPPDFSMVSFGAVWVYDTSKTFYGKVQPISTRWDPDALKISGITREEHFTFDFPHIVMPEFAEWIDSLKLERPTLISDNPAFDWQWINYYFHSYYKSNPFGFSARRIGDFYAGATLSLNNTGSWKKMRKTKHTHNPVDDAKGNAEALLEIMNKYKITI
jgi:hypothetical protein